MQATIVEGKGFVLSFSIYPLGSTPAVFVGRMANVKKVQGGLRRAD